MIAPATRKSSGTAAAQTLFAEVQALFAEARRRRRRRLLAAGLAGVIVAGAATAGVAAGWPDPGRPPARTARQAMALRHVVRFALPGATVAWVDYGGRLHVGDVASRSQQVIAALPGGQPGPRLVRAGERLFWIGGADVREFDLATRRVGTVARGEAVFASADGRDVLVVQRDGTRLLELPARGSGALRVLALPKGWSAAGYPSGAAAGGVLVQSGSPGGRQAGRNTFAIWDPQTARVTAARSGTPFASYRRPGGRYSLIAWQPDGCQHRCPVEITNTATRSTIVVRSPLRWGFADPGVVFSPGGSYLAAFVNTDDPGNSGETPTSVPAIINTRTGALRMVPGARLLTYENAAWALWLPGGHRLLAGALVYSYAVDTTTLAARQFYFFPQAGEGRNADHDIMDTPDINFSAVLVPRAASGGRAPGASR